MGKTRDLFKKIRDVKGTFHTKMGSIKDRNGMDLTEAEDIKKNVNNFMKGKSFLTTSALVKRKAQHGANMLFCFFH